MTTTAPAQTSTPARPRPKRETRSDRSSAPLLRLLDRLGLSGQGLRVRLWNGAVLEAQGKAVATIQIRSPRTFAHLAAAPGELGLARAFLVGDVDVEGDLESTLRACRRALAGGGHPSRGEAARALRAAVLAGALRKLPRAPASEVRLSGRRHSPDRDAAAAAHHYDLPEAFYRLLLGPSLTYSCAYFREPGIGLADAQDAKHDLILRKLGVGRGTRLLDVGCGWGSLALRAAGTGARVVGITNSAEQAAAAGRRVAEAGLAERVEIRLQDYRDIDDGPFDAIASVGMVEHVGTQNLEPYFHHLRALLPPGGRLLNHGISRNYPIEPMSSNRNFFQRYIFPDGELQPVGTMVAAMGAAGLEIRDVESLREHYRLTVRCWLDALDGSPAEAVGLAGEERTRAWRLYLAAAADAFGRGAVSLHQVLGIVRHGDGSSHMPLTRADWP
jgi:cyclopropane-fatty-acyl-phospholipid synthase